MTVIACGGHTAGQASTSGILTEEEQLDSPSHQDVLLRQLPGADLDGCNG